MNECPLYRPADTSGIDSETLRENYEQISARIRLYRYQIDVSIDVQSNRLHKVLEFCIRADTRIKQFIINHFFKE